MKNNSKFKLITVTLVLLTILISCTSKTAPTADAKISQKQNEIEFRQTLQKLLTAIENRDLDYLKSTLSPTGELQLILPDEKTTNTVDDFVALHQKWFKDTTWTIKTEILNTKVGNTIGMATTSAMYKEPERNGKPYFNHIIVSYVLEKIDGKWYIIKDHACSIEKTKPTTSK